MTRLRSITALGLCLFVALTSLTLAVARGAPQPAGQIVLCTGDGPRSVSVDASGAPMAPPHVCPDCLLAFHATAPRDPLPEAHRTPGTLRHPVAQAGHIAALVRPAIGARAPPPPV